MNRQVCRAGGHRSVVVLDIPLLAENPRDGLQGIIVVDVPVEVQVDRLVRYRGFDEADARARIGRQATAKQRLEQPTSSSTTAGDVDGSDRADRSDVGVADLTAAPPAA